MRPPWRAIPSRRALGYQLRAGVRWIMWTPRRMVWTVLGVVCLMMLLILIAPSPGRSHRHATAGPTSSPTPFLYGYQPSPSPSPSPTPSPTSSPAPSVSPAAGTATAAAARFVGLWLAGRTAKSPAVWLDSLRPSVEPELVPILQTTVLPQIPAGTVDGTVERSGNTTGANVEVTITGGSSVIVRLVADAGRWQVVQFGPQAGA